MENITPENFIEDYIVEDIREGKANRVQTRHPPEPSGYLHIGHVRNIMLNYGIAERFGGVCNLRYDDTNPSKECQEFVDAIQEDVKWLGYHWNKIHYATDYFQQNYEVAVKLIKEGKAYVCDLKPDEVTAYRGTFTEPGKNSPYRDRSIEENLDLFERMKNGEFEQGTRCLRAKIDMASPNMNLRDPVIYKIQYLHHQRIGTSWNIYPTYDFAHPLDDALEGVTFSICGPEFEDHRPLYNWVVENSGIENHPREIEYSNLYIKGAIIGKRFIKQLVNEGKVTGFDDPRLYTIRGLRRRGVLPESLKNFVKATGVSKAVSLIEPSFMEHFVRNTLNEKAYRVMAVLDPVKLVITNWEDGKEEAVELTNYPQKEQSEKRTYYFGKELLIDRADFSEFQIPKYFRFYPGNEVRLMGAYILKCESFEKDENGKVTTIYCTYDPETKSGSGCTKKVKGTIHWVNPKHAHKIECRLFENLIDEESAEEVEGQERATDGYKINPNSKIVLEDCYVEDIDFDFEERYQFVRNGYFCLDQDSRPEKLVFNRTITLKDTKKV
ncbi:MAG: glutamine--tRNA ligase/YqeY domain fusion protein [Clostridiales bacterium]|nr:glutamine--tRNA ligase/YqeY domain fusion protein [Clostridiales bacterium]